MKRLLFALALFAFAAAPALADPKSDLMTALMQTAKQPSFHVTATDKGKTFDMDMALPDKMHMMMGPMEMIKLGSTMYLKMNGTWRQMNMPGMDAMMGNVANYVAYARGKYNPDDTVVTDLGMKSPDGIPMHAYSVTNKGDHDPTMLYIDSSSRLARVDAADGAVVRFSKWGAIDPIVAPI
jgi:hypothetical protein